MARNRTNQQRNREEYEPRTGSTSTSSFVNHLIYLPKANEWREGIPVEQKEGPDHRFWLILLRRTKAPDKHKGKKISHKQLPERYLNQQSQQTKAS